MVMRKPIVIDRDIDLEKASKILTKKNISSLIFIKNSQPIGIVTKGDIVRHFGKKTTVSKIMSKNVLTISPNEKPSNAITILNENKISVLPVVEEGMLVGVVSAKDLLYGVCKIDEFLFE